MSSLSLLKCSTVTVNKLQLGICRGSTLGGMNNVPLLQLLRNHLVWQTRRCWGLHRGHHSLGSKPADLSTYCCLVAGACCDVSIPFRPCEGTWTLGNPTGSIWPSTSPSNPHVSNTACHVAGVVTSGDCRQRALMGERGSTSAFPGEARIRKLAKELHTRTSPRTILRRLEALTKAFEDEQTGGKAALAFLRAGASSATSGARPRHPNPLTQ
jgi:hypothetical protein